MASRANRPNPRSAPGRRNAPATCNQLDDWKRRRVMKPATRFATAAAVGSILVMVTTASVLAQSPGVSAGVTASGTTQFRDAKTGMVWRPENVSKDNRLEPANPPSTPADKAFDPRAQVATAGTVTVQRPRAQLMGSVPVTAGPTVPIITIDGPSLQAIPGGRWLTVLYVTNNSGAPVDPQIGCTFTNGGRSVQEARVVVPTTAAGTRLGVPVYGPRTDIFVDRVLCRVLTP